MPITLPADPVRRILLDLLSMERAYCREIGSWTDALAELGTTIEGVPEAADLWDYAMTLLGVPAESKQFSREWLSEKWQTVIEAQDEGMTSIEQYLAWVVAEVNAGKTGVGGARPSGGAAGRRH